MSLELFEEGASMEGGIGQSCDLIKATSANSGVQILPSRQRRSSLHWPDLGSQRKARLMAAGSRSLCPWEGGSGGRLGSSSAGDCGSRKGFQCFWRQSQAAAWASWTLAKASDCTDMTGVLLDLSSGITDSQVSSPSGGPGHHSRKFKDICSEH